MTGVTPLMVLRFPRVCCPKANVTGLHDWSRTQHCPVVLSLADGLQDCNRLIWHKPHLNLQHQASPCLEQRFRAALKAQSSDDAWAAWVQLAFWLDSSPSPYKLASPRVIKGKAKDREYFTFNESTETHPCTCSSTGLDRHRFHTVINREIAQGRKEALRHWKESMNNTKNDASWIRDGLAQPAVLTSDPRTITEQGLAILNEWLPRWTQPPDENQRQNSAAILCRKMQACELCPWTDPVPWTPAMIRQFCNTSAAGLDGLPFDAFAALSDDILNLLCQLYDAFDAGLAFPSCWTSARLVCIQKPDGGIHPITILSAAYRIWGKRTAQNLATWTSWFPSQLVGGRPSGHRAAGTANEILTAISNFHSNSRFLAGAFLDIAKCFDSLSLNSAKELFQARIL